MKELLHRWTLMTLTPHISISNEVGNIVLAQRAKKLSTYVEGWSLFYYRSYTFRIWWLITFKSLDELKQSCLFHLNMLVCGINASSPKWSGYIFILCHNHLILALLLYKKVLVISFWPANTVSRCVYKKSYHRLY